MSLPTRATVQSAVVKLAVNKFTLTSATPAVKEVMTLIDQYVEAQKRDMIGKEVEAI